MRGLRLAFLALIIIFASCHPKYKTCNCESKNEELKAYSEIVNEIVEHRSYNMYLGKDFERIWQEYAKFDADTAKIRKEVIRLQNRLYNDTSRFCIIYLDTVSTWKFSHRVCCFQNDTSRYGRRLKKFINQFSNKDQYVLDSVNNIQNRYLAKDFILCTSRIKMSEDYKNDSGKCVIGKIRLSKIYFNATRTKGLLYYEFCGYGDLVKIGKITNRWHITDTLQIWIF